MKNGRITLLVKAYNDDWYSIPTFIEVEIKNDKPSKPSGFLPGFEAGLIITCVILILVMGYNKKRKR